MNKISQIKETMCTGCSACYNRCQTNAISMKQDEYGFYKPEINMSKCIKCGECDAVCPVLNPIYYNAETDICYAVWANDEIRKVSSSGGVFDTLAKKMILQKGVVFGAAWTKDFFVHTVSITTENELDKLRRSKYGQTFVGYAYKEVKKYLENKTPVLYVGTPCQIAGLNSFLNGIDTSLLVTVDFICWYNPSINDVRNWLEENYGINNIKDFRFRDKSYGWVSHAFKVEKIDGQEIISKDYSTFSKGFYNLLFESDACINCKFSGLQRQADITLGDFWKIETHDPSWNDGKGTSMVWINNDKGRDFLEKIVPMLSRIEKVPMSWVREGQANGKACHKNREYYRLLVEKSGFNQAVSLALEDKFDIGFVCVQSYHNFGSALTNYAMYNVLCDLGYTVKIITQPLSSVNKPTVPSNFESRAYPGYASAKYYPNIESMKELNKHCDTFLVGSDQLFNYEIYKLIDGFIKLDWVEDSHKKLSYAASFGQDKLLGPLEERERLSASLKKFDMFSVREKSGIDLCRQLGKNATHVLDPVFLCNVKHYKRLGDKATQLADRPSQYVFNYILDPSASKEKIIYNYEFLFGLPSVSVSDRWRDKSNVESLWNKNTIIGLTNEQWVSCFEKADLIITDSYHGMCFAIIFNKPFVAIINKNRGAARFYSLSKLLNLAKYHIQVDELEIIDCSKLDYSEINYILSCEKNRSLKWLSDALRAPKVKPHEIKSNIESNEKKQESNKKTSFCLKKKLFSFLNKEK